MNAEQNTTHFTKNNMTNVFKSCLNILRDHEGLTGEKALRNMTFLLILKLLEPHFENKTVDLESQKYYFINKSPDYQSKLMIISRFSMLAKQSDVDLPYFLNLLWKDILSEHKVTKKIFSKDKSFDIKNDTTYRLLIDQLLKIDVQESGVDVLGNAYEEVIQDIMTGKVLGQFFTQPVVKNMMVKLVNPRVYPDGTIDTCGDPTMGTGGFLISYLKAVTKQADDDRIGIDWNFVKNQGLYGKEIETDTYQLAVSNMLISTGHMFDKLDHGDSIRDPITRKFDVILANPPFGIKGLRHDSIKGSFVEDYVPIKTDNAVSLFIQAIIHMLNIGGRCAVVVPDGKDLFSTSPALVRVREYLMKTCNLLEVIYLPSGIFTHTSVKTCVLYFVKTVEGASVISLSSSKDKNLYKFSETIETKKVSFIKFDPYNHEKTLICEVLGNTIADNKFSLKHSDYLIAPDTNPLVSLDVVFKRLEEVCVFLKKSKRPASYGIKGDGAYPFFTSSSRCTKHCSEFDYSDECMIIGTGGVANLKLASKFSCSSDNFILKAETPVLTKYLYYYLSNNIHLLQNGFMGVGIEHISKEYIKKIAVQIPSNDIQQKVIDTYIVIEDKITKHRHAIDDLEQVKLKVLTDFLE